MILKANQIKRQMKNNIYYRVKANHKEIKLFKIRIKNKQ